MKKIIALITCTAILIMSLQTISFATSSDITKNDTTKSDVASIENKQAEALKSLGLFMGTNLGFELDRDLTRMESVVMLIRMLGKEGDALSIEPNHPFDDIPTWENADKYIGYAYENDLIKGVSENIFDSNAKVTAQMYCVLMLRALGYDDEKSAETWENWEEISNKINLIPQNIDKDNFTRGSVVSISYNALEVDLNEKDVSLAETLMENYIFTPFVYEKAKIIAGNDVTIDSSLESMAAKTYLDVNINSNFLMQTEITKENMSYYLGINELDMVRGIAYEGMMSFAHSVCLVEMKDGADIEKAKNDIKENVDPRKWICVGVEPENVRVSNIGNIIILVMDDKYPNALITNFLSIDKNANLVETIENSYYKIGDYYMQKGKEIDENTVQNFADKLNQIKDTYLQNANNVYYSIIPDKTYYFKDVIESYTDHKLITDMLRSKINGFNEIDLTNSLGIDDYYFTDPHWKQDRILEIASSFGAAMEFNVDKYNFEQKSIDTFVGSYQTSIENLPSEKLLWLTSEKLDKIIVTNEGDKTFNSIYDERKLNTKSQFDMFLSGPTPLTVLENPEYDGKRELVIFRDSFASNLVPLFADQYSKITLVDLRYMFSSLLNDYVSFDGADVLFLYSDAVVNNSWSLK